MQHAINADQSEGATLLSLVDVNGNPFQRSAYTAPEDDLRPASLDDLIGQPQVAETLPIYLKAAERRNEPIDHVLLTGGPGLGKTTIAQIIKNALHADYIYTAGRLCTIERINVWASQIYHNINELHRHTVIFVDEAGDIDRHAMTLLLPMLEQYIFEDLYIGKFTFIAATTDPARLLQPFRDRFAIQYELDYYTPDEMEKIVFRSMNKLLGDYDIDFDVIAEIARRSRGVPRIANNIIKRFVDFVDADDTEDPVEKVANIDLLRTTFRALDIDINGMSKTDRRVILAMAERYNFSPVGVKALASAAGVDPLNLEGLIEPPLVRAGYINREQRGRKLTQRGVDIAVGLMAKKPVEY